MPNIEDGPPEGMTIWEWMSANNIGSITEIEGKYVNPKGQGSRRREPTIQRQFGTNAPSQLIPSKVPGGHPSYVISEGALEQEEIDHIALVQEERDIAQSKRPKSNTAKAIGNLVTTAKKERRGKRFSTMKKMQAEGM